MNVFKEAKSAYQERKAEIVASRQVQERPRHPRRAYTMGEDMSTTSSRRSRRDPDRKRPSTRRHSGEPPKTRSIYPASEAAFEDGIESPKSAFPPTYSSPQSPASLRSPLSPGGISRRQTVKVGRGQDSYFPPVPVRSLSTGGIDMDLAYGEPPPNLFTSQTQDESELKGLVGRVKGLLDEANCLQYSTTQTISSLQRNPDAMAAVALTLAEISNLVKKMSPMMVFKLRSAAPAVFALLASPQFMIAAGVGVGVTIVAFGGYKIVKKIQEKKAAENQMEEMIELTADVSRIDQWRRGIAVAEAESAGTSVDGEFITPTAASMSKLNLRDEVEMAKTNNATRKTKSKGAKTAKTTKSTTSRTSKTTTKTKGDSTSKQKSSRSSKEKKPSPLRLMFQ